MNQRRREEVHAISIIMNIVLDLMGRMHNGTSGIDFFDKSGIVLTDEIDAHLHLELQRDIYPVLANNC